MQKTPETAENTSNAMNRTEIECIVNCRGDDEGCGFCTVNVFDRSKRRQWRDYGRVRHMFGVEALQ